MIFVFKSCNDIAKNKLQTFKINPDDAVNELNLSLIADSLFIVQLKPPKELTFAQVRQLHIGEKFILTTDNRSSAILAFDLQGNFLSSLNAIGRGPGEYLRLGPSFVNEDESWIEILTNSGDGFGLLRYSIPEFTYLGFQPYPVLYVDSGVKADQNYYLGNHQSVNTINDKPTNASFLAFCSDGNIATHLNYERKTDDYFMNFHADNFVKSESGEVYFSRMYDNIIYKIKDCKPHPKYLIDFGKFQTDNSVMYNPGREQLNYLNQASEVALFPFIKVHSSRFVMISYLYKSTVTIGTRLTNHDSNRHYIHMSENQNTLHAHKIKNDLSEFPEFIFWGPEYRGLLYNVSAGNYLIDVLLPGNPLREKYIINSRSGANEKFDPNSLLIVFIRPR